MLQNERGADIANGLWLWYGDVVLAPARTAGRMSQLSVWG